jgi:hypothetical protein
MSAIHAALDLGPVFLAGILVGAGILVETAIMPGVGTIRAARSTPCRREQADIRRAMKRAGL